MKLTLKEHEVLVNDLGNNNFSEAGELVWSWSISDCCTVHRSQIAGVISSLAKKGLVVCEGQGNESTVRVTSDGMNYLALHFKELR